MQTNIIQKQANYLMEQLRKKQEPDGGMLYFEQLMQCNLDNTPASLERLDSLFSTMRKSGITLERVLRHPKHKNFLLTVAVYIGNYSGACIDEVPMWFSYDSYSEVTKNDSTPKEFSFSLLGQFSSGCCLPLGSIMESFANPFSFEHYIKNLCANLLEKSQVDAIATASDVCNFYLKKVRTGKIIASRIAYLDLLKTIDFDYSLQSLERIDEVLANIKKIGDFANKKSFFKKNSPYNKFVKEPERQAFIYLLGCYIGMTSSKLAKTVPKWFNHKEIKELLGDSGYNFCIENNQIIVCDGGYLMMPLMAITNYLFDLDPDTSVGAVDFFKNIHRNSESNLSSYHLITNTETDNSLPEDWKTAVTLASQLAAWNLVQASDGCILAPMSLDYCPKAKTTTLINHVDGNVDSLLKKLERPPKNAKVPFGSLSYNNYTDLPTGSTDSIVLKIKVHSKPTLTVEFVLPYRYAKHPLGFAIYPFVHRQTEDGPKAKTIHALAQVFYEGAQEFKDPMTGTDYWSSYYIDTHDAFAPAAWLSQPISHFNHADSKITLLPLLSS